MSDLLAQAQAMQNQLMEAQANLESQEIEGSAGGGLVTALVSGTGELLSLNIKQEAVDPDDTETLADLIVAAVRDASENAKEAAARAMGPLAGGIPGFGSEGPGLPGIGGGSSAPVGFSLPGATTVPGESTTGATGSDEDAAGGKSTGGTESAAGGGSAGSSDRPASSSSGSGGGAGPTASGSESGAGKSASGSGADSSSARGFSAGGSGVGFVNPGSGTGSPGQNQG
jgi:nucleoid-associated protein EbfC